MGRGVSTQACSPPSAASTKGSATLASPETSKEGDLARVVESHSTAKDLAYGRSSLDPGGEKVVADAAEQSVALPQVLNCRGPIVQLPRIDHTGVLRRPGRLGEISGC